MPSAQRPEVLEWLTNYEGEVPFLRDVRRFYALRGYISDAQYTAVHRNYRADQEGRPVDERTPATGDDCPHIRNGIYAVDNGTHHLNYQIYTATRGGLQGKRLVKRKIGGTWKAFGFLTTEGELRVWQRFVADEENEEAYVVWAKALLGLLRHRVIATDHGTLQAAYDGIRYTVNYSTFCRVCNRRLTTPTSIEQGIGPECQRRSTERTTAAPQRDTDEYRRVVMEERARRQQEQAPAPGNYSERAVEQPALPLSELGTGLVQ